MHRFNCRFNRVPRTTTFLSLGRLPLLSTPPATYIIHFMKMDIAREGIINIFNIITRNYMHKYIHLEALHKTNKLKWEKQKAR